MKKRLYLFLALALLVLTGCGGRQIAPTTPNTDLHPEEASQGRTGFLETADGMYSVWTNESGSNLIQLIYFCPTGEETFYPLCSKPNCLHTDEDCNAFAGFGFGSYKGYLFTVVNNHFQQRYDVVRMNPDGTDRTVLTSVSFPLDASGASARFHRGKLFLEFSPDAALPLEEQIPRMVVVDLNTSEKTEPFTELFTTGGIYALDFECFSGDKAYISGQLRGEEYDDDDVSLPFIELDTAAGTYRMLFDLPICTPWVEGDTCYYVEIGKGFRERNLDTGEIKEIDFPSGDGVWAFYDKDYIYLTGAGNQEKNLYILTRDYQLLDKITLTNGEILNNVSTQRLLFARPNTVTPPFCSYLDKSQIGSGKLELRPITVNG